VFTGGIPPEVIGPILKPPVDVLPEGDRRKALRASGSSAPPDVQRFLRRKNTVESLGKPVIRGTRIPVELLLRKLAEGGSLTDLLNIASKDLA
jgi:hypothetical protein